MINELTVFVLGAGASAPYSLPTGHELTARVVNSIAYIAQNEHEKALLRRVQIDDFPFLFKMGDYLKRAKGMSIDSWLELNSLYREYGRILIAKEINKSENSVSVIERDWYSDLWANYLSPQCKTASDLRNCKAYFITFNYDRSLEHYLFEMACATFSDEDVSQIADIVCSIPIVHLHGRVGYLPWQPTHEKTFVRQYEVSHEWEDAVNGASMIKIISDAGDETQEYKTARHWLIKAKRIYFLGFGYHDENLQRLRSDSDKEKIQTQNIWGSSKGLNHRERGRLESENNLLGIKINLGAEHLDVIDFLKTCVPRY